MIDALSFIGSYALRPWISIDAGGLLGKLSRLGYEGGVVANLTYLMARNTHEGNLRLINEVRNTPKLYPAALMNPEYPYSVGLVEEYFRMGFKAIVIPIPYQGFRVDEPAAARVVNRAFKLGMAVLILARLEDERQYPRYIRFNKVLVGELANLLGKVNGEVVVSGLDYPEALRLVELAGPKFIVDLSSRGIFGKPYSHIEDLAKRMGVDRLILSLQIPFKSPSASLVKLELSDLSDNDKERILKDNVERILRL